MRRLFLVPLLLVVGCAGGSAAEPTNPTGAPALPGSADWSDALAGDGELAGGRASNGSKASGDDDAVDSYSGESASPGSGGGSSSGGTGTGASAPSGATSSGASGSGSSSSGGVSYDPGSSTSSSGGYYPPSPKPAGSVLTAGTWDDNRNFAFFTKYRESMAGTDGILGITQAEAQGAATAFGTNVTAKTSLDISLVIDTTGSMGDEIRYLQREFTILAQTIQGKYPKAEQHWSLVLYKDSSDEYVVRWFDFRADTNEFRSKLDTASAGGGGDFPEAPDQALAIAHRLSWRRDANVARLMFWVADAPHHVQDSATLTKAVKSARDKSIHIYPVASSGIDEFTEYTMRSAAQLTGGRYIFLTDDSGVGGSHKEPSTPCYFVTKLDNAILRMVDVELTGAYREPVATDIIRTNGAPQNGICQASGGPVSIY